MQSLAQGGVSTRAALTEENAAGFAPVPCSCVISHSQISALQFAVGLPLRQLVLKKERKNGVLSAIKQLGLRRPREARNAFRQYIWSQMRKGVPAPGRCS